MHLRNSSGCRSYTNKFKLEAINLANQVGNRQAARDLGINESSIRDWKRQQTAIEAAPKNKCLVSPRVTAKYPQIEVQLCLYIEQRRDKGLGVSRALILLEALRVELHWYNLVMAINHKVISNKLYKIFLLLII